MAISFENAKKFDEVMRLKRLNQGSQPWKGKGKGYWNGGAKSKGKGKAAFSLSWDASLDGSSDYWNESAYWQQPSY